MPIWFKLSFQNSNSPIMEHLEFFHDHSMIILAAVTVSTLMLMVSFMMNPKLNLFLSESQEMELFWTSVPAIMLVFIAMPSLKILYMADEISNSNLSFKTTGNQWYWTYEFPELNNYNFESFMSESPIRSITTSSQIMIPIKTPIRCLISSSDVLHSWTIPSLGIKADATPGRINQLFFSLNRPSILSGQCSEICGTNHSFMPISINSIPMKNFISKF